MALAGIGAGIAAFIPQALAYLSLNGRIGPSGVTERKMTWSAPHGLEVLASPEHGLFAWTPLAVVALIGLLLLAKTAGPAEAKRQARWVSICLVLMVAAQVYVAGSVESWTVAGAFGQRRFVALTLLLTVGLAALIQHARERRLGVLTGLVIGSCIWWNLGLMAQFGAGLMDRQRLELGRNAYTTFVVLPVRGPELAYRYLFDRASFYQSVR
jgi:hypothetical protein